MAIIKKNLIDLDSPLKVVISNSDENKSNNANNDIKQNIIDPEIELKYNQMLTEADTMVKEAKLESQRIISTAKRDAMELKDIAKETGHKEGFDTGYLEGKRKYEDLINEAEELRNVTQQKYKDYLNTAEQDIVELIMTIARKFILDSVSNCKEDVYSLVRQTIESCSQRTNITLRVAVTDYEYLEENRDKLLKDIAGIDELKIIADEELQSGSCIVDTPNGSIDSSIDIRLNKIENSLKKILATKIS